MSGKPEVSFEGRIVKQGRLFSPSTARNKDVIFEVLAGYAEGWTSVLEVASGTGEHVVCFATRSPGIRWFPGDPDQHSQNSIMSWIHDSDAENIEQPHGIDVRAEDWLPVSNQKFNAVISINMVHISPFQCAEGLMRGAARHLDSNGILFMYGPFKRHGNHTSDSNQAFDDDLKRRDPAWGIRDLENEIVPLANASGFELENVVPMPANNFCVIFRRN